MLQGPLPIKHSHAKQMSWGNEWAGEWGTWKNEITPLCGNFVKIYGGMMTEWNPHGSTAVVRNKSYLYSESFLQM